MNPLANQTFLGYTPTFLGFALTFLGFLIPLFFYVLPLKGYTMQHEMQHGNFYKIFLYFGTRLTKYLYLPTLSQIIPKSSQLKRFILSFLSPGSSDISDIFGHFWKHFGHFWKHFEHFRKNLLSNPTFMLSKCFIL